jgi:hypothetical protein
MAIVVVTSGRSGRMSGPLSSMSGRQRFIASHALEMEAKGQPDRVRRAQLIADKERQLEDQERQRRGQGPVGCREGTVRGARDEAVSP